MKNLRYALNRLNHRNEGIVAITFSLTIPAIIAAVGLSVDMGQAYLVHDRLGRSLDASALAAASSSGDTAAITQRFEDFFFANYPAQGLGEPYNLNLVLEDQLLTVSASADVYTKFMNIFGYDKITVSTSAQVVRETRGIEVALVMDNTGSMSSNNNIAALRTAATNFVDILYDRAPEDDTIKIALVPYSNSVNIGYYGLGEDEDGNPYDTAFVNNPNGYVYSQTNNQQWLGCVEALTYPLDTQEAVGPWEIYRYPSGSNRNSRCPRTTVVPLTSDTTKLYSAINYMNADGHTLGNYGMVWGGRVISPEFPFTEGADWDDEVWRKAIVMMTDGQNTVHPTYSAYGLTWQHSITVNDLNERFAEICEDLKSKGVLIYTVTFESNISESTKDYYRQCATDLSKYYDAPSQTDLIDAFETISNELSNLHIQR